MHSIFPVQFESWSYYLSFLCIFCCSSDLFKILLIKREEEYSPFHRIYASGYKDKIIILQIILQHTHCRLANLFGEHQKPYKITKYLNSNTYAITVQYTIHNGVAIHVHAKWKGSCKYTPPLPHPY